jgi:hypothetical protein
MRKQFIISVCVILLLTVTFYGQYQSLDSQAGQQANKFFSKMSSRCGDHYYFKYNEGKSFLYQCKYAPTVSVDGKAFRPKQLSEADRLNRVDPLPIAWEGYAKINLGLCRYQVYSPKDEPGYDAWGRWADKNHRSVFFKKTRAGWWFHNEPIGTELYTKDVIVPVDCNEVPGANKKTSEKLPSWQGEARVGNGALDGKVLKIPANYGRWIYVGTGPVVIGLGNPYSQIFVDGTNYTRNALGQTKSYNPDAIAPSLMLGAIIVKIGNNGTPLQPFSDSNYNSLSGYTINSNQEVYVAINDSYHGDNRGEHIIVIRGNNLNLNLEAPPSEQRPPTLGRNDDPDSSAFKTPDPTLARLIQDELRQKGNLNIEVEVFKSDSAWLRVNYKGGSLDRKKTQEMIHEIANRRNFRAVIYFQLQVKGQLIWVR